MGKLGDLIVRLQLKHDDYKKGLKQAEKDTKGFSANLSKGINFVKAAWAGVGVAAVAAGKKLVDEMTKASNNVGDFMNVKAKEIEAVWHTMITSITSGFDNFFNRASAASKAAKELAELEDAEFEMANSTKLLRSELMLQKALLDIDSKDATKGYTERIKAAKEYLRVTEDIYKIEEKFYKQLAEQAASTWLKSSSTPSGRILGYSQSNAAALYKFLKEYGTDTGLQDAVKNYRTAWKEGKELWAQTKSGKEALKWVNENRQNWEQTQYRRFALDLGWSYEEQHNDLQNGAKLVDYFEKSNKAHGAFLDETSRIRTRINTLQDALNKELEKQKETTEKAVDGLSEPLERLQNISAPALQMNLPDIIPDDWLERNREKIDAAVAEAMRLQGITEEINRQFNEAVVNSLSGATQALVDCIMGIEGADASQVLAALLKPFAQTMISLGEILLAEGLAVEVFNESLRSLKGGPAIAAGLGLIALGSALSAGIQALAGSSGSATSASSGASAASSSASSGVDTYQQEITVHVVGEISGDKIVLAGQKTLNKWNR